MVLTGTWYNQLGTTMTLQSTVNIQVGSLIFGVSGVMGGREM
jgi:hypothetical protein